MCNIVHWADFSKKGTFFGLAAGVVRSIEITFSVLSSSIVNCFDVVSVVRGVQTAFCKSFHWVRLQFVRLQISVSTDDRSICSRLGGTLVKIVPTDPSILCTAFVLS